MTSTSEQTPKADIVRQELQKTDLSQARRYDLVALLQQYEGAAEAQLMSHTARMANPVEANKTTADYMQRLDNLFLDLFP